MKNKKLLLCFAVLVAAMMCALGASAAEAYACYTPSNTTLTFYYDNYRSSRTGTTYSLNTGTAETGWHTDGTNENVTRVVFNSSFANARPTSTYDWFYRMTNLQAITGMSYLNTSEVTNMGWMFTNCQLLNAIDLAGFNTAKVTSMQAMFSGCLNLQVLDLTSFNTSKVSDMVYMFSGSTNLRTIYVGSGWSTAAVTNSGSMFYNCPSLVGGQGTTYSASHTNAQYAHIDGGPSNPGYFSEWKEAYACYTPSNTTLTFYHDNQRSSRTGTTYDLNTGSNEPGWETDGTNVNVTKVVFNSSFASAHPTSTCEWFYGMGSLVSITGMNYLNTSEVTNMARMFANCSNLPSIDVSNFNTSKVTDMAGTFGYCSKFTSLNVSNWNTSRVTSMYGMFNNCRNLTSLDVSNWNTSSVTDMTLMFCYCWSLPSLDVSNWNTSSVTDMVRMFYYCGDLTSLDLSNWNTAAVTSMVNMFYYCGNLQTVYVGDGWSTAAVARSDDMFYNCFDLVGGKGTRWSSSNPADKTYAHIDGGTSNPGYFTDIRPEAYACYTPSNTTLTFYCDNQRSSRTGTTYDLNEGANDPDWYTDGASFDVTKVVFNSSFANARPTTTFYWFCEMESLASITGIQYLNTSEVTNMAYMFTGGGELPSLDVSHFDTRNVTDMSYMFLGCYRLTALDVSGFDTRNVTNMSFMFMSCGDVTTLDVSGFDTRNVTNMSYMFDGCFNLTSLDVSNFNTSNVTDMQEMFSSCYALSSLDLSNFNTAKVTNMKDMFASCRGLTSLDLSSFNTSRVTRMDYMFVNCVNLPSLDLGSFNTSQVTNMTAMFSGCGSLRTIYVGSGWSTSAVTTSTSMFYNCASLVGGQGTAWNASNPTDKTYAHIDGGPSNPGYFTAKNAALRGDADGDGEVSISDVSKLTDYLLTGNASGVNLAGADADQDGEVAIADVSAIIDYLLAGTW